MKFLARMVQYAATKWLGKSLQLYSTSGNLGILKAIFPEPADTLTEDEVASLKTVPGVYEAYQGLHKLSLDVLVFGLSLFFLFCHWFIAVCRGRTFHIVAWSFHLEISAKMRQSVAPHCLSTPSRWQSFKGRHQAFEQCLRQQLKDKPILQLDGLMVLDRSKDSYC